MRIVMVAEMTERLVMRRRMRKSLARRNGSIFIF